MTELELKTSVSKFSDALNRLIELQNKEIDADILRDATIKRFEFTYELCWKSCKIYLNYKGIDAFNPRDVFENTFKQGLFKSTEEQALLGMLRDRSLMSHVYKESLANEVAKRIQETYIQTLQKVLSALQNS
ncbi:MAG: nucleotidyltransferase substrate binding protein (TIGR01987 family) [Candidatus Omnitrophota bacterium]|jgi:nucleotidyltransferase substrate binding protein (TIGR01987 family)